jgi:hypothetical protein
MFVKSSDAWERNDSCCRPYGCELWACASGPRELNLPSGFLIRTLCCRANCNNLSDLSNSKLCYYIRSKLELLYDMWFTAKQSVVAPKLLEVHDHSFLLQVNSRVHSNIPSEEKKGLYITNSLRFCKVYVSHITDGQSSTFLLALASTILGFGPPWCSWLYFCSSITFMCFEMGPPLRREGSLTLEWGVTLSSLFHSLTDGHTNWPCV